MYQRTTVIRQRSNVRCRGISSFREKPGRHRDSRKLQRKQIQRADGHHQTDNRKGRAVQIACCRSSGSPQQPKRGMSLTHWSASKPAQSNDEEAR